MSATFVTYKLTWFFLILLALLRVVASNRFAEGEEVSLRGQILSQKLELEGLALILPKGEEIFYGEYVEVKGIYKDRKVFVTSINSKSQGILLPIRQKLIDASISSLPYPHGPLIAGMVMGERSGLLFEEKEKLRNVGLSHVVVASGTNVSLVGGFVLSVGLLLLKRNRAILFSLVFIWVYIFLSGIDPPLVRAGIMVSTVYAGLFAGRKSNTVRILAITVFVMIIINPLWIWDLGFKLSIAATLGLILFERFINSKLLFLPPIFREGCSTSLAAQILVFPILLWESGQINLIAPFINALVLWSVPFITIMGIVSTFVSLINTQLSQVLALAIYPFTWWFWNNVSLFSQ